ncbi:MAG TPA: NifU family protein, partial [Actinomycetota bacterium]|nr:NifU family protein [Actinomycetota bacterium]
MSGAQTTVEDRVREALEVIRPAIQMDGGDIELIGIHEGTVTVRLLGTCEACPISPVTLRHGVERVLRERVPGITEIVAIEG